MTIEINIHAINAVKVTTPTSTRHSIAKYIKKYIYIYIYYVTYWQARQLGGLWGEPGVEAAFLHNVTSDLCPRVCVCMCMQGYVDGRYYYCLPNMYEVCSLDGDGKASAEKIRDCAQAAWRRNAWILEI